MLALTKTTKQRYSDKLTSSNIWRIELNTLDQKNFRFEIGDEGEN